MTFKIGIFDSGSGGFSTLAAVRQLLPKAEYYYIGDVAHCPYGAKTPAELLEITSAIVEQLQAWGANLVVIACNTATTRCIHELRQRFPEILFIGTEPALKVARDQNYQHPLLLATPATASAQSVQRLVANNYPSSPIAILPCSGLADTIKSTLTNPKILQLRPGDALPTIKIPTSAEPIIVAKLHELLNQQLQTNNFDCVILGCTHYILIRDLVQQFFPTLAFIDGNRGVAHHIKATYDKLVLR